MVVIKLRLPRSTIYNYFLRKKTKQNDGDIYTYVRQGGQDLAGPRARSQEPTYNVCISRYTDTTSMFLVLRVRVPVRMCVGMHPDRTNKHMPYILTFNACHAKNLA